MKLFSLWALLILWGLTLFSPVVYSQKIDYQGFPEWSWQEEGECEYMLYTPSGLTEGEKYPLAVFLHGCCGEDEHATMRNAVDPPARMWHQFGENRQEEPTYIISPKTTRGWKQKFPDLKNVIDRMIASGKVDGQRIYMAGFSMGGAGTWQFMEQYPGYLAAAIPMGMNARANLETVRHTPTWSVRGEEDWYCRDLPAQIDSLRELNGDKRGSLEWVTGVNPRYSSFEGVGHGVQWDATSTLPLVEWAFSKTNDGNTYPVVYFIEPEHPAEYQHPETINLELYAEDPDGSIRTIEVYQNSEKRFEISERPFRIGIDLVKGDNHIEAIARDDGGKRSRASLMLQVDVSPEINTQKLTESTAGSYYHAVLSGSGNHPLAYSLEKGSRLPEGLTLDGKGSITGIPVIPGVYPIRVVLTDGGEGEHTRDYQLLVKEKSPGDVVVSNVHYPHDSLQARVSSIRVGECPNTQTNTEVSFSDVGSYEGLTYIATSQDATDLDQDDLLSFTVDEDVTVYVAYECLNRLYSSTIPKWLMEFEKVDGDPIVAQYRTFDIYSRCFPAGTIILPGADGKSHNVSRNYFVMVRKQY